MGAPSWFSNLLEARNLSGQQLDELFAHYELLERWNRKMSLTTVKSGEEMVERHYAESLFFGEHFPAEPRSIADIGSGAGFPGMPLAIQRPDCAVTLVESNQRKAVFLREAARGLSNVRVVAQRAEEASGSYDWVVSRAVNPLEVAGLIPKLAPNIGLMIGEDDYLALKKLPHIAWLDPVRLPWGDRRICAFGRVVPRETGST